MLGSEPRHPLQDEIDSTLVEFRRKYTDKNIAWKMFRAKFKGRVEEKFLERELDKVWPSRKTELRVRAYRSSTNLSNLVLVVEVWSNKMPGRIAKGEKEYSRYDFGVNLAGEVETLAAALATRQNLMFGDNHDPAACAQQARELFADMMHKAESDAKALAKGSTVH